MAVQLHYYGSAFDLDPKNSDAFWVDHIDTEMARVRELGATSIMSVKLADGRTAAIPLTPGSPLVVVR